MTTHVLEQSEALKRYSQRWKKQTLQVMALLAIILLAAWYVDVLNFELLANGLPAIGTLASESFPPDFTHLRDWFSPLLDTLAMSIAGTAIAVMFSVPMAFLAARNTSPHGVVFQLARVVLNALRSVPELIMGIIFVAAVGFGALDRKSVV